MSGGEEGHGLSHIGGESGVVAHLQQQAQAQALALALAQALAQALALVLALVLAWRGVRAGRRRPKSPSRP